MTTISTLRNWCWRSMPRVSRPARPPRCGSSRSARSGGAAAAPPAAISPATRLVSGTSAVGISQRPSVVLEQILGEFRQLAGAVHGGVVDQRRARPSPRSRARSVCRSSMNWPSARSSRASAPRRTVKRAPASLAAAAKSISPSASPSSKCWLAARSRGRGGSPQLLQHDVGALVGAVRHVGVEDVGQASSRPRYRRLERARALPSSASISPRSAVAFGFQRGGVGAGAPALADLLRQRVAPRLLLLQRRSARRRGARHRTSASDGSSARSRACRASSARRHRRHRNAAADRRGCAAGDVVHRDSDPRRGFGSTIRAAMMEISYSSDQRHGEAGLGDDVGRRQHGGDDEHADIGVAAEPLQRLRTDDADLAPAASAPPAARRRYRRRRSASSPGRDIR